MMALTRIGSAATAADLTGVFARSSFVATADFAQHKEPRPKQTLCHRRYPEAPRLPLPSNVCELSNAETTRFASERSRDIAAPLFAYKANPNCRLSSSLSTIGNFNCQVHLDKYDCSDVVNLSGLMQTNVPVPFCSHNRSTHLNMPGGHLARDEKYLAGDRSKTCFGSAYENSASRGSYLIGLRYYTTSASTSNPSSSKSSSTNDNVKDNKISEVKSEQQKIWESMSKRERLKIIMRDYGRTVIVFHIGISLISLGCFYTVIKSGLDVTPVIKLIAGAAGRGEDDLVQQVMGQGSTFLIAYAVHKLFAPVRISITLAFTPTIVKYLRRKGILKPPKTNPVVK